MKKKRALLLTIIVHYLVFTIIKCHKPHKQLLQQTFQNSEQTSQNPVKITVIYQKKNQNNFSRKKVKVKILQKKNITKSNISQKKITKNKSTKINDIPISNPKALYAKKSLDKQKVTLSLAGWQWENAPQPKDETKETGKIVFEIVVDQYGELIGIKTIEKSISSNLERAYIAALEGTTFLKDNEEGEVSAQSIGTVTFFLEYE